LPEPLTDGRIDIEGHEIIAVQTGQSDTAHSTYLHVPELGAVIVGDIAYNDVHMHLGATDHAKRMQWIQTLCEIGSLNPRTVIAAHCRPNAPHTPDVVAKSISYIVDFDRIFATDAGASRLIDEMKAAHPTRLSLTTLHSAAYMLAS
jgi:glyoxylase-like metal-dependent hydrolase (beta-lactamase superfamily II)